MCVIFFSFFQYGYIHGKHNSTDKSLYFINHQNPPFLFLETTLYKTTLYRSIKSSIPPFYQFSEFLKPTLSKVWVTNYRQFRLSLLLLLRQNCTPNLRWACFLHYLKMINNFWKEKKNNASILKQIVWETRSLWEKFSLGSIRSSPGTFKESY